MIKKIIIILIIILILLTSLEFKVIILAKNTEFTEDTEITCGHACNVDGWHDAVIIGQNKAAAEQARINSLIDINVTHAYAEASSEDLCTSGYYFLCNQVEWIYIPEIDSTVAGYQNKILIILPQDTVEYYNLDSIIKVRNVYSGDGAPDTVYINDKYECILLDAHKTSDGATHGEVGLIYKH